MEELITIVVPVYKVERYLEKCVESVLKQTYSNLEIILVDDGSPDNCGKICDSYAALDNRVVVIHKENGGLSDARNVAIDIAKGQYIAFVDSDDYVHEQYISYLYELLLDNCADISICEFDHMTEEGIRINHPLSNKKQMILNQKEALSTLLMQRPFSNSASGKLFKTSAFADIRFPKGKLYEDTATVYRLFFKAERIAFGARPLYYYIAHKGSISKRGFSIQQMDALYNAERMVKDIVLKYPDLQNAGYCRLIDPCAALLKSIPRENQPETFNMVVMKMCEIRNRVLFSKEATLKRRLIAAVSYLNTSCLIGLLKKL